MTGLLYDGQIENPLEKALEWERGRSWCGRPGDAVTAQRGAKKDLQVVCWTVTIPPTCAC